MRVLTVKTVNFHYECKLVNTKGAPILRDCEVGYELENGLVVMANRTHAVQIFASKEEVDLSRSVTGANIVRISYGETCERSEAHIMEWLWLAIEAFGEKSVPLEYLEVIPEIFTVKDVLGLAMVRFNAFAPIRKLIARTPEESNTRKLAKNERYRKDINVIGTLANWHSLPDDASVHSIWISF